MRNCPISYWEYIGPEAHGNHYTTWEELNWSFEMCLAFGLITEKTKLRVGLFLERKISQKESARVLGISICRMRQEIERVLRLARIRQRHLPDMLLAPRLVESDLAWT